MLFSIFTSKWDLLCEHYIENPDFFVANPIYFTRSQASVKQIWNCFAHGIRLEDHDNFYNNSLKDWKRTYDSNIITLETRIKNFDKSVSNLKEGEIEFSETSKKILTATVGNYIK